MTLRRDSITPPEKVQEIIDAYATGVNQIIVAKLCECSKQRVSLVLNRLGLVRRGCNTKESRPPDVEPAKVRKVLRLYRSGMSYNAVMLETDVSATQCAVVVKYYEPDLARSMTEQMKIQKKNRPMGFELSALGLKSGGRCGACDVLIVVPQEAGDGKQDCGLCVAYQDRRAA